MLMPKRLCLVVSSRSVRWQLNRKSSAADGGKFQIRYFQAIGAGRAECSSTRYVNDMSEWSEVLRYRIVIRFDTIHERDGQTRRHRMTAYAALMHSIAWQKLLA